MISSLDTASSNENAPELWPGRAGQGSACGRPMACEPEATPGHHQGQPVHQGITIPVNGQALTAGANQ